MEEGDSQIREHRLLEGLRPDSSRLDAQILIFLHRWANHEALMAFRHLLADEGIDPCPVGLIYQEGIHILPSGRPLIDDGNFQIAVHEQGQRSGNGS